MKKRKRKREPSDERTPFSPLLPSFITPHFGEAEEGATKNSPASTPFAFTEPVEGRDVNRGIAIPPPAPPFRLEGETWMPKCGEEEWRVDDLGKSKRKEKKRERSARMNGKIGWKKHVEMRRVERKLTSSSSSPISNPSSPPAPVTAPLNVVTSSSSSSNLPKTSSG